MTVENDLLINELRSFILTELMTGKENRTLEADDDLLEDSLVDSLGIMRLVTFIGDRYGVIVPAEDVTIENFATIDAIVDYLKPRVGDHVG